MKVKIVSTTQDIEGMMSHEELIIKIARVSNPSNQGNHQTAPRLIKYLIDHKHWSPFEMVDITFEITTSRAIAAQILRHRSFSFQEFSQRYAEVQGMEPLEFRQQAEKNRQSSEEIHVNGYNYKVDVYESIELLFDMYKEMVENGVSKETARMILPMATTTRLYMKGSVRSWIHYLQIRTGPDTQKEHREIAQAIQVIFNKYFPKTAEALNMDGND